MSVDRLCLLVYFWKEKLTEVSIAQKYFFA